MSLAREIVRPDGHRIAWLEDADGDARQPRPTVLLLHGIAETSEAFRAWVPALARDCRVIRPDFRGYGRSSRIPPGEALVIESLMADTQELIATLDVPRVHLVGAKLGAQVALRLAQHRPPWLASLSVAGILISPRDALGNWLEQWCAMIDEGGVRAWATQTMRGRMGSMQQDQLDHWIDFMAQAEPEAVKTYLRMLPTLCEPEHLEQIQCLTQVLVAVEPGDHAAYNQRQPLDEVRRWQSRIPGSRICEIPADSYHIAASHPDACARVVEALIKEIET